ncbi:MAG: ABC transporter ATP-binding protein [Deltaproteobacteria bacterium]|nr:ABC transporter ATP-binding protein [Deltaproteobacteria bacterium]
MSGDAASFDSGSEGERIRRPRDPQLIKQLWSVLSPHRRLLLFALLLIPLGSLLHLAPPFLLKKTIDEAIVPRALQNIAPYGILLIIVLVVEHLTGFVQLALMQIAGQRAMSDLRTQAHRHLLGLRVSYFDRTPIGRVMTRVTNDVESISESFSAGLVTLVGDILTLIGIVIAMLWLNVRLALLTFCVLPLLTVAVVTFQRVLRQTYRVIRRRLAHINATLQEHISGVKVVQIFAREQHAALEFDQANRAYRDSYHRAIAFDAGLYAIVEMLSSVTVAALLWFSGLRVGEGITFGMLVAFIEYAQRFFIPIRDMSAKYAVIQQALSAAERVFGLLAVDEPDAPRGQRPSLPTTPAHRVDTTVPAVEFRGVHASYDGQTPVLKDVSFSIAAGATVAIVGPTGAGKTTVIRLLTRLYDIDRGQILLYGNDICQIDVAELRRRVVVLSQDIYLFGGTVRSNITLEDPAIDDAQVVDAARRVGLLDLLSLDATVAERGANLSAGERQLIVFARALARDPEILVLDEATANVDPESERIVQAGIAELMHSRTAIVIAHRLTTIQAVDSVMVFADGRLSERGSHAELLERNGIYARLYQLQYVSQAPVPLA